MVDTKPKDALYFVTEQACCLAQAQGRETADFLACREAASYLADGDMSRFDQLTGAVAHDLKGDKDYDTEQYDGKRDDVRQAIRALMSLGKRPDTPQEKRGPVIAAAELIAAFYGMDGTLEPMPS